MLYYAILYYTVNLGDTGCAVADSSSGHVLRAGPLFSNSEELIYTPPPSPPREGGVEKLLC